jgi:hypothetical protein
MNARCRLNLRSIHDRTGISRSRPLVAAAFRNALRKNAVATLIHSRDQPTAPDADAQIAGNANSLSKHEL